MLSLINDEMSSISASEESALKNRFCFTLFVMYFVVFLDENCTFLK